MGKKCLVCMVVICLLSSFLFAKSEKESGDVEWIQRFYEGYLNASDTTRRSFAKSYHLFSQEIEALLQENERLCATLSRGDDICGYAADGDNYLDAQEWSPDINFKNSEFQSTHIKEGDVQVTFTLWPGNHAEYQRNKRFLLEKMDKGWAVKDMFSGTQLERGMRYTIEQENKGIRAAAADLYEAKSWVHTYLRSNIVDERVVRFILFPLEIKAVTGETLTLLKAEDPHYKTAINTFRALIRKEPSERHDSKHAPLLGREKETRRIGRETYLFHAGTWWLTKIDLKVP